MAILRLYTSDHCKHRLRWSPDVHSSGDRHPHMIPRRDERRTGPGGPYRQEFDHTAATWARWTEIRNTPTRLTASGKTSYRTRVQRTRALNGWVAHTRSPRPQNPPCPPLRKGGKGPGPGRLTFPPY